MGAVIVLTNIYEWIEGWLQLKKERAKVGLSTPVLVDTTMMAFVKKNSISEFNSVYLCKINSGIVVPLLETLIR